MALLSALLWAAASLVDKLAVNWGYRTLEVLPATYTAGFLVVALCYQHSAELWDIRYILSGAILAFFSLLNAFSLLMALRCGEVGLVSVVAGSHCVITAVMANILLGEQLTERQWLAVLMAVIGLFLVFGISESLRRGGFKSAESGYRWFWLALLSAIGSSGETLALKQATAISSGAHLSLLWEYFIASLVCFFLVFRYQVKLNLRSSLFGSIDGVLTGFGMMAFGLALALGPASLVATVATAAVLFRAIGGIVFFGDKAGRQQWIGFGLLFAAFILVRI